MNNCLLKNIFRYLVFGVLMFFAVVAAFIYKSPPISYSIPSPSGSVSIVKRWNGEGSYVVNLMPLHRWFYNSIQVLPPQEAENIVDNGIIFGWENDQHLIIGWPTGLRPIHGLDHVEDISITYRPYEPDIDRIVGNKIFKLRLHDLVVSFMETESSQGLYKSTYRPVPMRKCIIEISGFDGEVFEGVTTQIIGNGHGLPNDQNTSFGMIDVNFVFSNAVGRYASLTPTQAKVGPVFPDLMKSVPAQTPNSLYYRSYNPSEVLDLFSWLTKGKFDVKVGLNFGQEIIFYEADIILNNDVIDKFNACSAKTNIYGQPFHVPSGD